MTTWLSEVTATGLAEGDGVITVYVVMGVVVADGIGSGEPRCWR